MADDLKAPDRSADQRPGPAPRADVRRETGRGVRIVSSVWRSYSLRVKLTTLLTILVVWEVFVGQFGLDYMATPLGVLSVAPEMLTTDEQLWGDTADTLWAVARGLVVGCVGGVLLGLATGRIYWLERMLGPYINGLYATPMIAILPVFTLWLGFSDATRFAIVVFAALPPMAIGAWEGARSIPKKYLEVATTFGAKRRHVWFGIAVPSSLPYLIAAFRLSSGRALTAAVVAEFLTAVNGLGIYVMNLTRTFRHDEAVVGVVILALVGLALTIGLQKLIDRAMPWYRNI